MIVRSIVLSFSILTLSSCVTPFEFRSCTGSVPANIQYDEGMIKITPKEIKIKRGRSIRFKVQGPDGHKVTISGKPAIGDPNKWIQGTGKKAGANLFIPICVDPSQAPGDYSYDVEIEGIGKIDPRVKVRT